MNTKIWKTKVKWRAFSVGMPLSGFSSSTSDE